MTKEEIKKIIDLIIIEERKTPEQVFTLEMFNLWQESDQQNKALLKDVESLMSTINKLSGGTLSGILEKQLEGRTLSSKCFDLANELAMAGFGDDAVYLHKVHNKLINT